MEGIGIATTFAEELLIKTHTPPPRWGAVLSVRNNVYEQPPNITSLVVRGDSHDSVMHKTSYL
jgi:hypothetical protein